MSKRTATFKITIEVPFYEYDTKTKNVKAEAQIKEQIGELLSKDFDNLFFDLVVEDDEMDATEAAKVRIDKVD